MWPAHPYLDLAHVPTRVLSQRSGHARVTGWSSRCRGRGRSGQVLDHAGKLRPGGGGAQRMRERDRERGAATAQVLDEDCPRDTVSADAASVKPRIGCRRRLRWSRSRSRSSPPPRQGHPSRGAVAGDTMCRADRGDDVTEQDTRRRWHSRACEPRAGARRRARLATDGTPTALGRQLPVAALRAAREPYPAARSRSPRATDAHPGNRDDRPEQRDCLYTGAERGHDSAVPKGSRRVPLWCPGGR